MTQWPLLPSATVFAETWCFLKCVSRILSMGEGVCLAKGGMHGKGEGGMCGKGGICISKGGHVWQRETSMEKGACVASWCAWWGACIAGAHAWQWGMHGSVHGKGCAWQGCVHGRREAHCCKRYASYLNAFLLNLFLLDLANLTWQEILEKN